MIKSLRLAAAISLLSCNVAFAAEPLTFQPMIIPDGVVTRAELVKMVVDQLYPAAKNDACFKTLSPSDYWLLFSDVSIKESYAPSLCFAMKTGIIRGYADGTFRPDRPVNFAEASKILSRAFDLSPEIYGSHDGPWYRASVMALEEHAAIPGSVTGFSHPMTGVEVYDIVNRLATRDVTRPSVSYGELQRREAGAN
ncbi:MAG TPA: S-layer homology domain-containing protein [Candidatus Peribacteria bacterium]|nr:S-layer homology domain-containing protein [Candidatus Peribacteria bacterium]